MIRFQLLSTDDDAIQFSGGKKDEESGAYPFVATVSYVGKLSTHMVGGTDSIEGGPYRVFISSELGKKKLNELVGKSVFVTDSLDTHENGIQAGKFLKSWMEATGETGETGDEVYAIKASGIIYRNTKPELIEKVIGEARKKKLGFSYDLKAGLFKLRSLQSDDAEQPPEQYVELTDFSWRGATILYRDAAAYSETKLAASKIQEKEHDTMDTKQAEAILASQEKMTATLTALAEVVGKQSARIEAIEKGGSKQTTKATAGAVPVEGFIKTIIEGVTSANKPLIDAVAKLVEIQADQMKNQPTKPGERKSLTIADLQLKGTGNLKGDEVVTDEILIAAQQAIGNNPNMSREQKSAELARIGQVRTAMSIGHPSGRN